MQISLPNRLLFNFLAPNFSVLMMFMINFITITFGDTKYKIKFSYFAILSFLIFSTYCLTTFLVTGEIGLLRLTFIVFLLPLIAEIDDKAFLSLIKLILVLTLCYVLFEISFPYSEVRLFYRSSLNEIHIYRESGLFLYPGDLGHFGVLLFSLSQRLSSATTISSKKNSYF